MSSVYTLIPRPVGSFAGMDMTSRYAFGLIFDRWQLSAKDGSSKFKDRHGIYCVYSREALAAEMGISLPTLRAAINQLTERQLIEARMVKAGGALRYYVPQIVIEELRTSKKPQQHEKPAKGKELMLRHSKEAREETWKAAVVDLFDEEG